MSVAMAYLTVPKVLFTDERYKDLPSDAILLYSALQDRVKLSMKNKGQWINKKGEAFIYYTRKAMCQLLKKSEPYIRKMVDALKAVGLIKEKRQGLTKPNIIYVSVLVETEKQSKENRASAPERNEVSPNNPYPNKPYKKTFSKGKQESPYGCRDGEMWQENGQMMIFQHGYSQRHYTREELNSLIEVI